MKIIAKNLLYSPIVHILLIVVLGLLAYSNSFHVPFQFDDMTNIVENVKLGDFNNFWPPKGSRWFGFLTFALNYQLGGLDTFGYHVVNIIIHIFNAILVYYLVVLTFKTPFFSKAAQHTQNVIARSEATKQSPDFKIASPAARNDSLPTNTIALFSALLFVSHPIQTEAVTYIVQRFTSLVTMFYLLSLVMYIKWRLNNQQSAISYQLSAIGSQPSAPHPSLPLEGGGLGRGWRLHATRYTLYAVSVISAILAMKTKEISFTLPFIITLYEFSFFSKTMNHEPRTIKRFLYLLPFLLTLLIIPLSMSGINKPLGDVLSELKEYTAETDAIDRWSYLFTQFRVIVTYLRLLFFPINQNLLYGYPIYSSFFEPNVFLSFLFLLSIFGLGVYLFYRSRLTRTRAEQAPPLQNSTRYTLPATRLISFGIFWFFIALSVESSIIPIADVIFEHRLYLPSIGVFIALITVLFIVAERLRHRWQRINRAVVLSILMVVIVLTGATYARNAVWKDDVSLWSDVIRKSPGNARAYINVGVGYESKGLIDRAIRYYQIAIRLKPDDPGAYYNLGTAYYRRGMMDEAINEYHKALSLNPDHQDAQYNLSLVYKMKKAIDSKKKRKH